MDNRPDNVIDPELHEFPAVPIYGKKMFLIDIRTDRIKDNDFKYARIKRLMTPTNFGMTEDFFGGNVYTVVELKDKPFYLLVNRHHQTLGLCVKLDELDRLPKEELARWAEVQGVKVNTKDTKEDIIKKLTATPK